MAATLTFNEPIDLYHADREWWSKSQLWSLRDKGPLYFYERYLTGSISEHSGQAFRKGSLCHLWCEIGSDAWWGRVAIVPEEFVGANGAILKKGEGWVSEQPADAIILKPSEANAYRRQFDRLSSNKFFCQLQDSTEHREFSVRSTCPDSGLKVRCRPDAATIDTIWDLKTTSDQCPIRTWHKSVHDFGYGFQAALYLRLAREAGFAPERFAFVVSSTVPPYEALVVVLPQAYLDQCERQLLDTCRDLQSRLLLDHWQPVEAGQITELWMPPWTMEEKSSEAGQQHRRCE